MYVKVGKSPDKITQSEVLFLCLAPDERIDYRNEKD